MRQQNVHFSERFVMFRSQIHEKIDDLGQGTGPLQVESLKTGNVGARLGCGVIRLAPVIIGQQDPDVETS